MRLPTLDGQDNRIDKERAQEIIDYAMSHGINYYDTAYRYHGGESERFIGQALKKYPRESFLLASKFPGHMMVKKGGGVVGFTSGLAGWPDNTVAGVFAEQLEKCQVDYFDFYLLHNVNDSTINNYMSNPGAIEYFKEQKRLGRIRHFGFSCHSNLENLKKMLDWQDCWEFVQIQCNYLDWTLQDAKGKYEELTRRGIPVIVMEPCRGGRLATLGEEADAMLKAARPDDTIASWAFRFIKSLPNVQVCLSGMTTMDQAIDNVKTFSTEETMSQADSDLLQGALAEMMRHYSAPCTACRYCCDGCPMELDIPMLIAAYNDLSLGFNFTPVMRLEALPEDKLPSACLACGACAEICPQGIPIPDILAELSERYASMPKWSDICRQRAEEAARMNDKG
jgi:predicted aldo/keto reductase-like oxidoreductase